MISLIVNGIKIKQTKSHLKKFNEKGGTKNNAENFPKIKFPDQNMVVNISKKYAKYSLFKTILNKS